MGKHRSRRAIVGVAGALVIGLAGWLTYAVMTATAQNDVPSWRQQRLAFLKATYDRIQIDIAAGGNAAPSWRRQAESVLQDMATVAEPMPIDSVPPEIRALLRGSESPAKDGVTASAETTGIAETSAVPEPETDRAALPPSSGVPTTIATAPHSDDGAAAPPRAAGPLATASIGTSTDVISEETSSSQRFDVPLSPSDPPLPPTQPGGALQPEKTDRGLRVVLPVALLFSSADDALAPTADPPLSRLAELIGTMEPHEIVINVHSDASGANAADLRLSKQRAHTVVVWLAAHGPKYKPHFVERGYGGIRPIKPKKNADGSEHVEGTAQSPQVEILLRRN